MRPLVILIFSIIFITACSDSSISWTSIHVSGENQSGDAHLLKFPDGKKILIDTGFSHYADGYLLPSLKNAKVKVLDKIIVTHAHRNHYGAIPNILDKMKVDDVYFNLPPMDTCAKETWSTGCNLEHIKNTYKRIQQDSNIHAIKQGDVIYEDQELGIKLVTLYYLEKVIKGIGVNDASAVFKLTYGESSVLFTGDIGTTAGLYLAKYGTEELKSTAMTAPHHGVADTAPNTFFDKVSPEIVVASISKGIFASDRGKRTREYFKEKTVPIYVTGELGNLNFKITPERIKFED